MISYFSKLSLISIAFLSLGANYAKAIDSKDLVPMCKTFIENDFGTPVGKSHESIACASYMMAVIETSVVMCSFLETEKSASAQEIKKTFASKATGNDLPQIVTLYVGLMENEETWKNNSPAVAISIIASNLKPCE